MKRMLLGTAVLAVLLAAEAAALLWNQKKATRWNAAELVPPETLLLAECPDIPATALRWKQTALHEILAEPELRAFLRLPSGPAGELARADWKTIRPRQAFLAVTSLAENHPLAVAGLAFDGDRGELEPVIARAMIGAQNASPRGQMKRQSYRGCSIIVFTDHGITVAGCFARRWYFAANDVELLKATLDRFLDRGHAALALSPKYQTSQAAGAGALTADFRFFAQPSRASSRLLAALENDSVGVTLPRVQFETASLAVRFEKRSIHDTLWLRRPPGRARPRLDGRTLALTTPNTVFYGAMAPQLETWFSASGSSGQPGPGSLIPTLLAGLPSGGGSMLVQFQAAFGPEHALILDWPPGEPQPGFFLASEIRDPAQARRFMETLFRAWDRAEGSGMLLWSFPMAQPALLHPAVALVGGHVVAGFSPESLKPFATRAFATEVSGTGTLDRSPAFHASLASLASPETGLAYLDAAALFERLYGALRPFALLWGSSVPRLDRYADFGRLPSARAVSRHLSPIGLTVRQSQDGVIVDTSGPVSFVEISTGLGAAAFYALLPAWRARERPSPGIAPPPFLKPLSRPVPDGS